MSTDAMARAIEILRRGGLVAFPTETVYGLGADARNAAAVRRIYAAKGRPDTNPLIVHVADEVVARRYAAKWPEAAHRLAERFWPGPLTLVVPRVLEGSGRVADEVSAGRATVALRAPDHPLALALLRNFDGPIAGPSANRSTRVSPTTAQHVRDELEGNVDLVLDGGPCCVGIESTVLDLCGEDPVILRPGGISRDQIEAEVGRVRVFTGSIEPGAVAMSPGQQAIHYAPRAPAYRFEAERRAEMEAAAICRRTGGSPLPGGGNAGGPPVPCDSAAFLFLGRDEAPALPEAAGIIGRRFVMPADPTSYARELYRVLRVLDARGVGEIWIEMPPHTPEWAAVRDRLLRATQDSLCWYCGTSFALPAGEL